MKRFISLFICCGLILPLIGCGNQKETAQVVATTLPVYEFTVRICENTGITVSQLITQSVSCLHDYTLQTGQMREIAAADAVIISGAGLEDFLEDALLDAKNTIDASAQIDLICSHHGHDDGDDHHHTADPHIWLSPANADIMANNIYLGLTDTYPEHKDLFLKNLQALSADLYALQMFANEQLKDLSCRDIVTFHDGFSYMANAFDLQILKAIEEESGSEASASELIELIGIVEEYQLPAVFTECNGSTSAASIISAETNTKISALNMALSGESYFDAMYYNISILKEALG